jgi:hypothetical protein
LTRKGGGNTAAHNMMVHNVLRRRAVNRKDLLLKRVLETFTTTHNETEAQLIKDIRFALYPIRFEQGVVVVSNKPENQK